MIGALVAGITGSGGASLSSYESIATATGTGSSNTITFSSIPSTYTHLQIRGIMLNTPGSGDNMSVRFNSDSGSNYAYHQLTGDGASAAATGASSVTLMLGAYHTATQYGATVIDILDYKNTSKNKTMRTLHGSDANGSGFVILRSGLWMNTNAITSISLLAGSGNWTTATTFALYGIKEA